MKIKLNSVKSELNVFDLKKWSKHTQSRDVAGHVFSLLRNSVKPELLTQAWCKFYEIVCSFPLLNSINGASFNSLHLCEAPGAFICALNHFLVLNFPHIRWNWQANTLNPNYEGNNLCHMIPDDRLICHTYENWLFGCDQTGDIQKFYNHCDIVQQIVLRDKVSLVTADGSIDCMKNPGEQEKLVEYLHYCEAMTAFRVLKNGGSLVLKIFTIFEDSTICLLYLLNCIFGEVSLFKPCTSKSGNSEVYVVCVDFCGFDLLNPLWDSLVEPYKKGYFDENFSMFSLDDIPHSFINQVRTSCEYFFIGWQINVIKNNIHIFLNKDENDNEALERFKRNIAATYKGKYRLKMIPKNKKIVSNFNIYDKKKRKFSDFEFITQVNGNTISVFGNNLTDYINLTYGLRIKKVFSSRFISIDDLNKILRYKENISEYERVSPLYTYIFKKLSEYCTIINITGFDISVYYRYQKDLLKALLSAAKENKHIFLINIPFHTHFLAGIWCILACGFEQVYFNCGCLIFYKPTLNLNKVIQVFNKIQESYDLVQNTEFESDLINLFPYSIFDTHLHLIVNILNISNSFYVPD
ncbi:cap-specific mRNA (nucleoside-2'-O-)-methyltransferase 2 isoform X2 [Sitophilus oryzae]|nr:cap-specific mRNA (nucleoside-2'-O-)-methyltransferase 2 isoform X2 [Sitophilus oryzae]